MLARYRQIPCICCIYRHIFLLNYCSYATFQELHLFQPNSLMRTFVFVGALYLAASTQTLCGLFERCYPSHLIFLPWPAEKAEAKQSQQNPNAGCYSISNTWEHHRYSLEVQICLLFWMCNNNFPSQLNFKVV